MLRLFFGLLFPLTLGAQAKRFQFSEMKMGSSFTIIFYHTDSIEANTIARSCFSLVDSLNAVFSDYSSRSEVGSLNTQASYQQLKPSPELFSMILRARQAWLLSSHSFDVTIGALSQLWRRAKRQQEFPGKDEVEKAKAMTGFENLLVDEQKRTISTRKYGIQLDFGGIVPGYAAQKVIDYLHSINIHQALADASGDIVVSGAPPGKAGWTIGINLPESENEIWDRQLGLTHCAVSTSGDVYRYTLHDGIKYSHIIDPRTGYGLTSQRNVTVIAKDGATADWLATACSILSIPQAMALAKQQKAQLLVAILRDGKIKTYRTKGFDNYFNPKLP
jgi:thiamine biosynthesis lipoprotein